MVPSGSRRGQQMPTQADGSPSIQVAYASERVELTPQREQEDLDSVFVSQYPCRLDAQCDEKRVQVGQVVRLICSPQRIDARLGHRRLYLRTCDRETKRPGID